MLELSNFTMLIQIRSRDDQAPGVEIEEDNHTAQTAAQDISGKQRAFRHRMLYVNFLISAAREGLTQYTHIPGPQQVADILTKTYGPLDHWRKLGWLMGQSDELQRLMRIVVERYGKSSTAAQAHAAQRATPDQQPGDTEETPDAQEAQQAQSAKDNAMTNTHSATEPLRRALGELRMYLSERREQAEEEARNEAARAQRRGDPARTTKEQKRDAKRNSSISDKEWRDIYEKSMRTAVQQQIREKGTKRQRSDTEELEERTAASDYFNTMDNSEEEDDDAMEVATDTEARRDWGQGSAHRGDDDAQQSHSADESKGKRPRARVHGKAKKAHEARRQAQRKQQREA
jgi:hypothetical protein